jgi:hypothetical protein
MILEVVPSYSAQAQKNKINASVNSATNEDPSQSYGVCANGATNDSYTEVLNL